MEGTTRGPSAAERREIADQLGRALVRDELRVHYQPRISLGTGRIVGAEALLRWENRELGAIGPDRFIPIAEATGAIVPIGRFVLEEACRALVRFRRAGLENLLLSVNVSPVQLARDPLDETVARALAEAGTPAESLELEVTEGRMLPRLQPARRMLSRIRDAGVRISLDDFGSGYAALDMVIELPLDTLKVDRSIIRRVGTHPGATTVARTIVDMAHALGLTVVAEGVGGRAQLARLAALGCDEAQGFEIAPALPEAAFMALVRRGERVRLREEAGITAPTWQRVPIPTAASRTTGNTGRTLRTPASGSVRNVRAGSGATNGASASSCRPGSSA